MRALSRRAALVGLAALPAASSLAALTDNPAVPGRYDPREPANNLEAFMKVWGTLDGRRSWLWAQGQVFVEGVAEVPVYVTDFSVCRISDFKRADADSWEQLFWSCMLFHERGAETLPSTIRNPVTGKSVTPGHYRGGPTRLLYTTKGIRVPGKPDENPLKGTVPGQNLDPWLLPWTVQGDDLWITFDSEFRPYGNDVYIFHARMSEVQDPARADAPTDYSYFADSRLYPWLEMGDSPAHLVWHGAGAKALAPEGVPPLLRRLGDERYPGLFETPERYTEKEKRPG